MLLSIDPDKIREQLAKNPPAYTVTPYNLEVAPILPAQPTAEVWSAVTEMPPDVKRLWERLATLRQSLINNGEQPLSPDALEQEINRTRGR